MYLKKIQKTLKQRQKRRRAKELFFLQAESFLWKQSKKKKTAVNTKNNNKFVLSDRKKNSVKETHSFVYTSTLHLERKGWSRCKCSLAWLVCESVSTKKDLKRDESAKKHAIFFLSFFTLCTFSAKDQRI